MTYHRRVKVETAWFFQTYITIICSAVLLIHFSCYFGKLGLFLPPGAYKFPTCSFHVPLDFVFNQIWQNNVLGWVKLCSKTGFQKKKIGDRMKNWERLKRISRCIRRIHWISGWGKRFSNWKKQSAGQRGPIADCGPLIWNTYMWKLQNLCRNQYEQIMAWFVRVIWHKYHPWYSKLSQISLV